MIEADTTILLPVRNEAPLLARALDTLSRQTGLRFQTIVTDDGSDDASPGILAAHSGRNPRLTVLTTPPRGLVPALELARSHARTPYLARMDADDVCHPERFRLQRDYLLAHPRVAAVGCRVVPFPRRDVGPGWRRYLDWINSLITPEDHRRERFVESPLVHPSVMMRADAVEQVGGYRDTPWAEDYDLWLRLLEAGWELAKIDRPLFAWRHHPDRLSATSPRYSPDQFLACRAHYLARIPEFKGKRILVWGAGKTGRKLGRLLKQEAITIEAFYEVDASKIGRTCLDAPVHAWETLEPAGRLPLVIAVGAPGARDLIRPAVRERGYREGIDAFYAG